MSDINVFENRPTDDYVYYQYRKDEVINQFFKTIDIFIEEHYYTNALELLWECKNLSKSTSVYMYFYAKHYLGLIRPVRTNPADFSSEDVGKNVINEYDTAVFWDQRFIWDDTSQNNPEMPITLFIILLKYVYNYGEVTWTYDLIIRFAATMCNINPNDIHISFETSKVVFWLYNSTICRTFIEYMKQDEYKLNFPFADCYEFRVGSHRKNTSNIDEFMLGYNRPDNWPTYNF